MKRIQWESNRCLRSLKAFRDQRLGLLFHWNNHFDQHLWGRARVRSNRRTWSMSHFMEA